MADNLPTNVQFETNQNGTVTFASDVLATIAGLAATEIEGVASMTGTTNLADILSRKNQSKSLTRGVKVEIENNAVNVDVTIIVDFGSPIPEVAYGIQENVKKAIETMSGMMVSRVDVHVQGLSFEKEHKSTVEIEMQQRKLLHKAPPKSEEDEKAPEAAPAEKSVAREPEVTENMEAAPETIEEIDDGEYELILDDVDDEECEAGSEEIADAPDAPPSETDKD